MKVVYIILIIMLSVSACYGGVTPDEQEKQLPHDGSIVDMVLIYGGSAHRNVSWDKDHFSPYVSHTDRMSKEHWLFDGFLFLDIIDGKGKIFATGYNGLPATMKEWKSLADYFFTPGQSVDALDKSIAARVPVLGNLPSKRKVIIGLPEPIVGGPGSDYKTVPTDYWGTLDNRKLDFTMQDDRIAACKWYIDYVRSKFNEGKYQNIELTGFYWIAEETLHTKTILSAIGNYLNEAQLSFNWIPYWKNNPDYLNWKELGFDVTYLQPNYFFNDKVPYSRLQEACKVVTEHDLDLELEFDLRVFVENGDRSARLYDYMKAFRENGMLTGKRIAYYQDCDAIYQLYRSSNEKNQAIFRDFCDFVLEHQSKYKGF